MEKPSTTKRHFFTEDEKLFLSICFFTVAVGILLPPASAYDTWVQDDFNRANGVLGTATNGNAWASITGTTPPTVSGNTMLLVDAGTNPSAFLTFNVTGGNETELCIDIMTTNNAANGVNVQLYSGASTVARFDMINSKYLRLQYSTASTLNISYIGNNVWYTVCVNQTNTTYARYSVNGVDKGVFRNYATNAGYITRIWIEGNTNSNHYTDNIVARVIPQCTPSYTYLTANGNATVWCQNTSLMRVNMFLLQADTNNCSGQYYTGNKTLYTTYNYSVLCDPAYWCPNCTNTTASNCTADLDTILAELEEMKMNPTMTLSIVQLVIFALCFLVIYIKPGWSYIRLSAVILFALIALVTTGALDDVPSSVRYLYYTLDVLLIIFSAVSTSMYEAPNPYLQRRGDN